MRRLVPALTLVVALGACAEPGGAPEAAYRELAKAVSQGRLDDAWALLSSETQAELTRAATAAAVAEGKPAPLDGRRFTFVQGSAPDRKLAAVTVVDRPSDGRAVLQVTDEAGDKRTVMAVKQGPAWRIDLAEALAAAARR
jgi:hypothetical protein